jgi:hypothetical protein
MELPLYAQQSQNLVMTVTAAIAAKANDGSGSSGIGPGAGVEAGLKLGETMSTFMPINYRELSKFPPVTRPQMMY